jgi:hypothetical protein
MNHSLLPPSPHSTFFARCTHLPNLHLIHGSAEPIFFFGQADLQAKLGEAFGLEGDQVNLFQPLISPVGSSQPTEKADPAEEWNKLYSEVSASV